MVNVVGFSRGGTHLFWCFISSHSQLKNAKEEINDFVGLKRLGLIGKLILEFDCLVGTYCRQFDFVQSHEVHKAVCSWYPNILFRVLRRHDPMKYIANSALSKHKTIFLVKSLTAQKKSWSRRGAPVEIAEKAYNEHLENWKLYSRSHDCLFVSYEKFCADPVRTTKNIWSWLALPEECFPKMIAIKPKAYSSQPNLLQANSIHRSWQFVDSRQLCESLKIDGRSSSP